MKFDFSHCSSVAVLMHRSLRVDCSCEFIMAGLVLDFWFVVQGVDLEVVFWFGCLPNQVDLKIVFDDFDDLEIVLN